MFVVFFILRLWYVLLEFYVLKFYIVIWLNWSVFDVLFVCVFLIDENYELLIWYLSMYLFLFYIFLEDGNLFDKVFMVLILVWKIVKVKWVGCSCGIKILLNLVYGE